MVTLVTKKTDLLTQPRLVELLSYAMALLTYRHLASADDMRVFKALLDELPHDKTMQKAA